MATINHKLKIIAADLFIKYDSKERNYITEKINNLIAKIDLYFGNSISEIVLFGSFKRGTILPRGFDENSDVDILIVFNQASKALTPETYRTQLKKFAELKYTTSTVIKSHPSIVLEMDKIKFDLVPCRVNPSWWNSEYQIPDRQGDWMNTNPKRFNEILTAANILYDELVKPIIRLLKRWNAYNDYPYSSFALEQIIAEMNFNKYNYETGFLYAIDKLPTSNLSKTKAEKVKILKLRGSLITRYLDINNQVEAFETLEHILGLTF